MREGRHNAEVKLNLSEVVQRVVGYKIFHHYFYFSKLLGKHEPIRDLLEQFVSFCGQN